MSMTLGNSCHHPLGVEVVHPLSAGLIVSQVLHAPFGSRALLPVLRHAKGLIMRALLPQ
jgi:hypothetical protein